jgi:hypothetical protein
MAQYKNHLLSLHRRTSGDLYLFQKKSSPQGSRKSLGDELETSGNTDNLLITKVETCDRPVRKWLARLFLDRKGASVLVKFDDTIGFGIIDIKAKTVAPVSRTCPGPSNSGSS